VDSKDVSALTMIVEGEVGEAACTLETSYGEAGRVHEVVLDVAELIGTGVVELSATNPLRVRDELLTVELRFEPAAARENNSAHVVVREKMFDDRGDTWNWSFQACEHHVVICSHFGRRGRCEQGTYRRTCRRRTRVRR